MDTKLSTNRKLKRMLANILSIVVILAMAFPVTGSALAEEPAPPRIYANLTDDSIRYELTDPYTPVTFSIYAAQDGERLSEITKNADETGFVWISIWEHRQELTPGTFIVVTDGIHTNELEVKEVSIDVVNADENILSGKAPAGSFVWVVANNEPDRCGVSIEAADNTWQFDFDDLGCDITADMVFYAQVMDDEGDTSEANPDFIDGWHDGAEGVGHPNSCNVTGFATDTDNRDRDLQIRVLSDGNEIASTLAEGFWDGFIGECGKDGTCGFYINLWGLEGFSLYQQHEITVQAYDVETDQWQNLGGTPRLLTCANYDLYIFDTKTGKAERLTINLPNEGEYNPSWSNNGKQIVHDVADANGHGLYITDVKTKNSMELPGGDGGNDASWSPNGKWIVFDRRWYDDPNLYLLPPMGGERQLVVENATNGDWSPDSQRLVFERDGGLWTASVNGGDEQQIVEAGYGPAWSPDGLWLAYDLEGDIWKIAVDEFGARAGDPIQLTSGPVSEGGATWSQDGQFIVFASDATGDHDIWQIAAEGGVPTQLRGAIGYGDYDPDYSNNGQYIAYEGAMEPSMPHVESDTWLNTYVLADWPVGQLINVSIDDPATSKQPDYRTTFTPDGTTNWYLFQPGLDIKPGSVITAKSKFFTKTLVVSTLAATNIDAENGVVSGVATPNTSFYMVADGDHFRLSSGQGVSVDENGNWSADFSGAEAPRPWTWYTGGEMFEWDVDGDMTHSFWHLHQEVIEVWLPYNEIRAFDWPLNTNVKFYVDGEEIATAPTEAAVWMNGTWATVNTGDLQLQPGMMITVTDGITTKDMVIQDIKITEFDAGNDLVYGYGPAGANLELGSWEDSPVFRFFNADGDGNWLVDYRTPSVNGVTVDLNPGDDLRLFTRDADKDATVWEAFVPNTRFTVWPDRNYLEGYEWPYGVTVSITVDGKEVCSTEATSEGDPSNTFFWVNFPEGCDIQAGDKITLSSGMFSITHQVQDLVISDVDVKAHTVAGTAVFDPAQYFLHTWINGVDGAYMELPDQSGDWLADFGSQGFDLQPGMSGRVELVDQASNATAVEWYIPNPRFRVRANTDQVEGWEWNVGDTVTLAVDDPDTGEGTDFTIDGNVEVASWDPNQIYVNFNLWNVYDIQAGDEVSLSTDSIAKITTVTNLAFTDIDVALNLVTGTAAPDSRVDIWACDNITCINRHINSDGAGNWTADFGNPGNEDDEQNTFDLVGGIWIDSSQVDEDNDETSWGERVPNPYIEAAPYSDWIHAREWPLGTAMTLNIDDPADGIGIQDVDHNPADYSESGIMQQAPWNPGDPNDIVADFRWPDQFAPGPGYVLTMIGDNGQTKTLTISQLNITNFDIEADVISGVGTANSQIQVCANIPNRCITRWVTADGDGNWTADYKTWAEGDDPETVDIQPGSNGWAAEYEADSDRTWFDWWIPNPRFVVFPEWEWFDGNDWPDGSNVDITVEGKPECTTSKVSSGNFFNGSFGEGCNVVVGDVVTFKDGETIRTHKVRNLAITEVDKEANKIYGTADIGALVYAWVHGYGYDQQLQVEDGTWLADFGAAGLDLIENMGGRAEVRDEFGNSTAVDWWIPNPVILAHPAYELIEGAGWMPGAEVTVTIDDPSNGGGVDYSDTQMVGGDNWLHFRLTNFDLQAGHIISMTDGSFVKTMVVSNLRVTGFNLDAHTVSGVGDPNSEFFIADNGMVVPVNEEGKWSATFDQLLPGSWWTIIQRYPDGNEMRETFRVSMPMMIAWKNWDDIAGSEWTPGAEVTLTIDDPTNGAGVDFSFTQTAMDSGNLYYGNVYFDLGIELQTGYILTMSDGNFTKMLVISALTVTGFDFDNHIIYGTGDPGAKLLVHINGVDSSWATVGDDHNWSVYHELLEPGVWLDAIQPDDDGDHTRDGGQALLE